MNWKWLEDLIKKLLDKRNKPEPKPEPPPPEPKPEPPPPCSVPARPTTSVTHGFVWKAKSESDHRLVVLISAGYRKHVQRLEVVWVWRDVAQQMLDKGRAEGERVEEVGRFDGDTHNGCRPHFRFSRAGEGYVGPEGWLTFVRWTLNDDSRASAQDKGFRVIRIPDPAKDLRT